MTFEVQQTRWDRMIRRVSGSIGPGSRVSETLSELFPVFDVEQAPAELLVLGGTQMAIGHTNENAVAAVFQNSELFNPVGSGSIITLLSISAFGGGGITLNMGLTTGSFTTNNPSLVGFADGRLLGAALPVGQCRDETSGAVGAKDYLLLPGIYQNGIFAPPKAIAVLTPGTGWAVGSSAVNLDLIVCYTWIERPAEQSELSL